MNSKIDIYQRQLHLYPYEYRIGDRVQYAAPTHVTFSYTIFNNEIPEFRTRDCVGYLPYDCHRCHDRRLWPGGPIVTTCGWEKCNRPYNTKCFDYRLSQLQVLVTASIPNNLISLIQSNQTCNNKAINEANRVLSNEINQLKLATQINDSTINNTVNKSAQVWLNTLANCIGTDPQLKQQIINSVQIVPSYSLKPTGDWKQFSSVYQLP